MVAIKSHMRKVVLKIQSWSLTEADQYETRLTSFQTFSYMIFVLKYILIVKFKYIYLH